MADNVTINAGSGGDSIAADDIAGAKYQRVKLVHGADGTNAGDVALANGFPVQAATGAAFPITDNGGSLTVDGTVAVSGSVAVTGTFYQATQPVSIAASVAVTGPLTDTELRASAVPVSLASVPSHAVTNAGTFAVQAAQSGTWVVTDGGDSLTVDGSVAVSNFPIGFLAAQSGSWTVGVSGSVAVTGTFWQATQPVSIAGTVTTTGGLTDTELRATAVPVSGTVAVTNAGTFATQAAQSGTWNVGIVTTVTTVSAVTAITNALPAGTNNIGDVDVLTVPSDPFGVNADAASATGSISAKLRFIAATGIPITGTVTVGSHAVTNEGTFAVQAASAGNVAHDSADSGNPVKIGAKAETSPKGITLVADGDRTDLLADADGQLVVKLGTSGADCISETVSNTDGNSTAFTNFSAVASTKNAVTAYSIFRTDSGTTMAYVDFRDGTAGSVIWRVPLPAGGGANLSLGGQPIFKTSANTALAFDVSSALTTVYISVSGFQTKV